MSLTSLAVFCQQVSDTPEKYTETGAAEAARLKREWLALQKSPPVSLQEQEEVELKQAELLLGEQKVQKAPLNGYWKLHM